MAGFSSVRRFLQGCVAASLLIVSAACGGLSPSGFSGDVDALLSRGDAYLTELSRTRVEALTDAEVVALGYAERARLGLGSPFRLVDYALVDPMLPDSVRERLAYGLLARTVGGRTYRVDPTSLEVARLRGVASDAAAAREQLRLIERAIFAAPSASAGERTVRLGYMLAAAERTVEPTATPVVAHVAALIGDRRRAQEDAVSLLRRAARSGQDPLVLLQTWRRELEFRVEQPSLIASTILEEEAEARDGPAFAVNLRSLAQRQGAPANPLYDTSDFGLIDAAPVLGAAVAERLRELAEIRNYPVQAPVAVAVEMNRDALLSRPGLEPWQRAARLRFVTDASNEERMAAASAILFASGAHVGQRLSLILLQSATFLRAWNQEEPWFPGDAAPTVRELEGRFGLTAIRFDADLEESWRPYYLRMLGRGLADLQRVLPTASFRGLTIRIGEVPQEISALALHEPGTRTLYLPPKTGAGTLAHELAHDLDWQLARRRYSIRGGYGTDLAVRSHRGDRIAAAMMELSSSLVQPASEAASASHNTRPAEVFARGVDWLVAAMLGRDGRLGGYLTSFQDPVLTGYGTTRGPDIRGAAVPALFSILDGIAPVADETRDWALDTYGPGRPLTGAELVRSVNESSRADWLEQSLYQINQMGARVRHAFNECRLASPEGLRRLAGAHRTLSEASVAAATRGALVEAAHQLAEAGGTLPRQTVDAWLAWRLYGAPEPLDPELDEMLPVLDDLLVRVETAASARSAAPVDRNAFHLDRTPTFCSGNPFAAEGTAGRLSPR